MPDVWEAAWARFCEAEPEAAAEGEARRARADLAAALKDAYGF